jgi:hypothetical protein
MIIRRDVKQADVLLSLFVSFALEYRFMKVKENKQGLDLNGTHKFSVCAGDVNLLDENVNIKF